MWVGASTDQLRVHIVLILRKRGVTPPLPHTSLMRNNFRFLLEKSIAIVNIVDLEVPTDLHSLNTCKYICIYVCTYVCMHEYVCIYVRMDTCMYVCMYVCTSVYICKAQQIIDGRGARAEFYCPPLIHKCMYVCTYIWMDG
jgi:hypothetical protein